VKDKGSGYMNPEKSPHIEMPQYTTERILEGQKALVTGTSLIVDGGMTPYPGFATGGC
jgi:hypothetical protein